MKNVDDLFEQIGVRGETQKIKDIYMLDILKDLQKGCIYEV